jgi:competence protein ComEA
MSEKNKHPSFTKYIIAAVAAVLVIGVTVTTVMIKAKRKEVIVIESNSKSTEENENISTSAKQASEKPEKNSSEKEHNKASGAKQETDKTAAEASVSFPIDINKATLEQLCTIEGVGEYTAKRILDYRDKVGTIGSMRQLLNVEGIGEKTLKKLEKYLYVSESDKTVTAGSGTEQTTKMPIKTSRTNKTTAAKTTKAAVTTQPTEPSEVNINKADAQEIAKALLISIENAQKIVDVREKIGGFKAKTEILLSKAVSEEDYIRLEKYIII